jgi:hypothetical protein
VIEEEAAYGLEMRRLLYGQLLACALCAMAELGLADELAAGPLTVRDLADRTGTDQAALTRLMRALAAFGVLAAGNADDSYALTPLGATLRSDVPGTALPTARLVSAVVGRAWDGLADAVRTGEPAFPKAFGEDFFSYLDGDPGLRDIFDRSQEAGLVLDVESVVAALPVSGRQVLVDVGGGDGALLSAVVSAHPQVRGIIVDRPTALQAAASRLAAAGVSDRIELIGGDFFADLPAGGDCYLVRHVLHNLDDLDCGRLLRACHRVMAGPASLCVVDFLIDGRPGGSDGDRDPQATQAAALMDLYMMSWFGAARERGPAEFNALLSTSGFAIDGISRSASGLGIITARKSGAALTEQHLRPSDAAAPSP